MKSAASGVHTSRLADAPPQPWRNGGGITHSLLAWPPGTADGDWLLRISVAYIHQDGPFSRFDGVARAFAVLRGAGVCLQFAGARTDLRTGDNPLHFDGTSAPGCSLLDGPTQDLNLMVRHSTGRAHMAKASPGSTLTGHPRWRGLYSTGPQRVWVDGDPLDLAADTLAWSDSDPGASWQLDPATPHPAPAWWLSLASPP